MFQRAPLRVRPAEGEPPGWLFQRLAHRNGFENPAEFARCFRMSVDDVRRGRANGRLSKLSAIPATALSEWSPQDNGTFVVLRGQTLRSPYDWASGMPAKPLRACPECIRSDLAERDGPKASRPFMRAWWCLRDVHHCHRHGCLLIELPARRPRPFAGPGARRGGARPFWVDFADAPSEPANPDTVCADRYVLGRLGLVPSAPHDVLDGLALGEASAMLSWLGELAVTGTKALDVRTLPFAEAMRVRSEGLALANEWPSRVVSRLDEVLEARLASEYGMGGYYGRFYRRLYDDRMMRDSHEGRDILRKLLERHALANVPFRHGETMFRLPVDASVRVHLNHAALIAGVTASEFESIANALGVLEQGRLATDHWGVTREAAERVKAACDRTVRAYRLAEMTEVPVGVIDELRQRGFISPVWELPNRGSSSQMYPTAIAGILLDRVSAMEAAHPRRRKYRRATSEPVTEPSD